MDGLTEGMRTMEILLRSGFLLLLAGAGFQDLKSHRVHIGIFMVFGAAGMVLRGIQLGIELLILSQALESGRIWVFAGRRLADLAMAMAPGGILLFISAITGEAVGRADGWFFVVSGLYLGLAGNLLLFFGGLLLCFMVCCFIMIIGICGGRNLGRLRLPFLPFLIPVGLGVMLL